MPFLQPQLAIHLGLDPGAGLRRPPGTRNHPKALLNKRKRYTFAAMNDVPSQRWLTTWLRRGLTALGVALLLLFLASVSLLVLARYPVMESDKTFDHELHLSVDGTYTIALFSELDPVTARESLRVIGIRFRGHDFALALSLDPHRGGKEAVGQIVAVDRRQGTLSKRDLRIPAATARRLFREWDRKIADYPGSPSETLDGNPLVFDRRSGGRAQSGAGNGCHYDDLADLLARRLGPFVPELNALRYTPKELVDRQAFCGPSIWGRMWHRLLT